MDAVPADDQDPLCVLISSGTVSKRAVRTSLALVVLGSLVTTGLAHAQHETLAGTWRASAMVERFTVNEWGPKCGPQPGGGGAPGGTVTISESGSELSISGAGRTYSTANCWEQTPGIMRVSHTASPRGWSSRCTTPQGDPRRATITTTTTATDDTISFVESGQYEFVLEGQRCSASVRRTRSFQILHRQGQNPPEVPPEPETQAAPTPAPVESSPPPVSDAPPAPASKGCEKPGEPWRLDVRPSRVLIRRGDSYSFRTRVFDVKGCLLSIVPTWRVQQGQAAISASSTGVVVAREDSPEGTTEVVVAVADKSTRVVVEVASSERYDSLLASRGLRGANDGDDSAVSMVGTGSLGGGVAVAKDAGKGRVVGFAAVVGAIALASAIVGLIALRRSARVRAHGRDRVASDHGSSPCDPVVQRAKRPPIVDAGPAPDSDCGRCALDAKCGGTKDSAFVSAAPACVALMPESRAKPPGKVCPSCGFRYESEAVFCGKDGTTLVYVNLSDG